jgi:YD repeat-containing protein
VGECYAYVTGDTKAADLRTAGAADITFSGEDDPASDAFVLNVNAAQRLTRSSYDGLQRLTGATESTGSAFAYTYDNAGNRTSVQLNGGTPTSATTPPAT